MDKEKQIDPFMVDEDNPEWTAEDFKESRPGSEVFAELGMEAPRPRGRPKLSNPKQATTLRLDADLVEKMKSTGKGWQTRANEILKEHFS